MTHVVVALQAVALPAKRVVNLSRLFVAECGPWLPCMVAIIVVVVVILRSGAMQRPQEEEKSEEEGHLPKASHLPD